MFHSEKLLGFLLSVAYISAHPVWNDTGDFKDSILSDATREIIEGFYEKRCSTLSIIRAPGNSSKFNEVITKILIESRGKFAARLDTELIENRKKRFNIIMIENIEAFRVLNEKITQRVFNYRGFYLLVLADGDIDDYEEIFATLWKKRLYNINVLAHEYDTANLMTFLPYDGSLCGDTRPKTINVFRNGSFSRKDVSFFPKKFTNMNSCRLNVATFEDGVAVIRKRHRNGTLNYSGFEMDLLRELSRTMNFTMELKFIEKDQPWGNIYSNGTSDGALGEAVKRESDIAIGCYTMTLSRLNMIESSIPYYSSPIVFVISPGQKLTDFEKLLQPFHEKVWICLTATICLALVVILILNFTKLSVKRFVYGSGIKHPSTNLLIAILGGSQTKLPQQNFSRFLLMMFLIFCLVVRNAYQGSLYKFLQTDSRHKNVQTINDMIDQKFDIYLFKSSIDVFDSQPRILDR